MRGDIYRMRAARSSRGHELAGNLYCVVIQSDNLNLSTWMVAPTSTAFREASFRPTIELDGRRTHVMVEHSTVVDPEVRLGQMVGRVSATELAAIDRALRLVLDV